MANKSSATQAAHPIMAVLPRMSEFRLQSELESVRENVSQLRISTDWTVSKRTKMIRDNNALEAIILAELARRAR